VDQCDLTRLSSPGKRRKYSKYALNQAKWGLHFKYQLYNPPEVYDSQTLPVVAAIAQNMCSSWHGGLLVVVLVFFNLRPHLISLASLGHLIALFVMIIYIA
jgi:hypothetical protein